MKKLIFLTLILGSLTAFGQRSGTHCLSIEDSRFLHERALKSVYLDSAVNALEGKVIVLEENSARRETDFVNLLNVQKKINSVQADILNHTESLLQSYKSEATDERKKKKGWKAASGVLGILLIIALL
jgi:hypothetical protein